MNEQERKEAERINLSAGTRDDTTRVTLAIAEKSAELAFSEGYRCAVREIAGIVLGMIVIYSMVYAIVGRE